MTWRAKPSATTKIEKRDIPYLTPQMLESYRKDVLPRYETKMGALMPILHDVQHHYGYIAAQAMVEIALFLEITPGDVLDTASFYEDYHLEPVGKYVVAVCQSIACEVCGHQAIVDYVREKLDIEPHETTDDGKFTLLTMECLGACDTAPCALVNDQRYDNLSITSLEKILESLPD
ncbi:MAG: NADH-quinone oxidoreductase subunit NuoE [Phycisphaerales bacterium]|jgi:NADH-quinone oxidoreductase E subunit|nr:NADH-quinone oxidoreductase subunit NuoE [Phycisphaerales bacterium]